MRFRWLRVFASLTAVALLILLGVRVSVAEAAPSLACTGLTPGASGVLDVTVSGTSSVTDLLTITQGSGNYSLSLTSGGSPSAVCTGTTYPDSGLSGFPTVKVIGSTVLSADFVASDDGLTFDGQSSAANTLDLSSLSGAVALSVSAGTVSWSGKQNSFSGITTFDGSAAGNTTFAANSTGGFTFVGVGSGNALDLTGAGSNVSASVPAGTVTLASGGDTFSGISAFVGSSSGGTDLVAGSGSISFQGKGAGNELDFSQVATSQFAPLKINVSGVFAGGLANNSAAAGATTYSFGDVTAFAGSGSGNTTFFAGSSGGFTFNGGGSSGNVLDAGAANSGATVSVPTGKVTGLTSGSDNFSGIQTFNGSGLGGTTFTAGSANGQTFNGPGNGNTFNGGSGADTFNAPGNGNTFVAGSGSGTFNGGAGSGNTLDFSPVATSQGSPLTVNLSGTSVGGTANNTATVGSTTYSFGGITTFSAATSGNTRFYPGTGGGYTFNGGSSDTLNLSFLSAGAATVSVPDGTLTVGSAQDSFTGITTFDGLPSGNTTFKANGTDGYTFAGSGTGNVLDLTAAGSNVTISVPAAAVTLASGLDDFSGVTSFIGSSSGGTALIVSGTSSFSFQGKGTGNELDLANVAASQATPLKINVSGVTAGSVANDTAVVGSTTYTFSDVSTLDGSGAGNTTFFAGGTGGFTFNGGGSSGNVLDLGAANSGATVSVPSGKVTGLTTGSDNFSGIQTFNGSGLGHTTFTGGSATGFTFNAAGNGNTFVAGSGSSTFNGGAGSGNTLDFSPVATSQGSPLTVNLSGTSVGGTANNTATVGSTTYSFAGITTFSAATSGNTRFYPGTGGGYTFNGGSSDTINLSFLSAGAATVSVPDGTLTVGSAQDSFTGITTFDGLPSGNTTFKANGSGGYTFAGSGTGNVLDLTSAGSGVTANAANGTVTLASGSDQFAGISAFVGSSSGGTTFVAGPSGSLTVQGKGTGNELDLADVTASQATPLKINVSGVTAGGVTNDTAMVGSTTYTFSNVSTLDGSSAGDTTFFAGGTGGFTFNGGGSSGNVLDLSAANSGAAVSVPTGKVAGLTSGSDDFSGIQTFNGSGAGGTTFTAGSTGGSTFNGIGSGNELDLGAAGSGVTASVPGGTVTLASGGDQFSDILIFDGSTAGHTDFVASGTAGGYNFNFAGSGDTLDLSALPGSGTTVSVPAGRVDWSNPTDFFSGAATFIGSSSGNTVFRAGSGGGFGFVAAGGTGNFLDLSSAGSGVTVSVPDETVTLASGSDDFSGITHFIGSNSGGSTVVAGSGNLSFEGQGGGNELSFSQVSASPATPLKINVSGSTTVGLADDSAVVGPTTYTFADVSTFVGTDSGNAIFFAGPTGGFAFNGGGSSGNVLDLSNAPGATVTVNGDSVADPGVVSGLDSGGTDSFSDIQSFTGGATVLERLSVAKTGGGTGTVTSSPAGIDCGSACSHNFTGGSSVELTAVAAAGSTFDGWSGACTGTGSCSVPMTSATAVTATFSLLPSFTLTVTPAGSGAGTVTSSPAGIDCGSTCSHDYTSGTNVTLTAAAAAGSTFAGWSGACTGTGSCSVPMTSATAVTATFSLLSTFTLSVSKSGNGDGTVTSAPAGIDCGSTCSHDYTSGTSVTLTAVAAAGSTFDGWSGSCTGKAACTVGMTAARSVTASFGKDCVVPNLKGKTLSAAKRALRAHACSVGKITHAFSTKVKKGRVVTEKPKPGRLLAPGAKVNLVLSKGRRRRS